MPKTKAAKLTRRINQYNRRIIKATVFSRQEQREKTNKMNSINCKPINIMFSITKNPREKETNPEIVTTINNYTGPLDGNSLRKLIMDTIRSKRHWVRMLSYTHHLIALIDYEYVKNKDKIELNCQETVILTNPE